MFEVIQSINFSLEKENDGRLSFLDINIFHEIGKFVTSVYWKKSFSGVYTNFNSFIPETYKTELIKPLLLWCFSLCLDFAKLHQEINILKVFCIKKLPTWLRWLRWQLYKKFFWQSINTKDFCKYST